MLRALLVLSCLGPLAGCITVGVGPYNAATAALVSSDGTGYTVAGDQSNVPAGLVRVFSESIDYRRAPAGVHWGVRKGWLGAGELTEMHIDVGLKIWKIALGYSRLWTWTTLDADAAGVSRSHDGMGNALRLSFAPLPPLSLDLLLGSATGELTSNTMGGMATLTPDVSLSRRALGLTVVPWGRGIWNVGLRIDYNFLEVDGVSTSGPSAELLLTIL